MQTDDWYPDDSCETCYGHGYVGRPPEIDPCPDCGGSSAVAEGDP